MKKTIVAGALVLSLFVVACNNDEATPAPATEAPGAAVESMAAEDVEAAESMAAEASMVAEEAEDAVESMAAEEVEAAESMAAEEVEAVESLAAEASPEAG